MFGGFFNTCTVSEMATADSYGHGPVVKFWDQTSTTDVSDELWVVVHTATVHTVF